MDLIQLEVEMHSTQLDVLSSSQFPFHARRFGRVFQRP